MKLTLAQKLDMPPVWLIACLGLAYAQSAYWPFAGFAGALWQLAAGVLVGGGVILMGLAFIEFNRAKTTVVPHQEPEALITSGIFKRSRNPIYLADILLLAGFSFYWGAWLGVILLPVLGLILTRRFIEPEEARLRAAFGGQFDAWALRTRRWL